VDEPLEAVAGESASNGSEPMHGGVAEPAPEAVSPPSPEE